MAITLRAIKSEIDGLKNDYNDLKKFVTSSLGTTGQNSQSLSDKLDQITDKIKKIGTSQSEAEVKLAQGNV